MTLDAAFLADAFQMAKDYGKDAILQQMYSTGPDYDPTNITVDHSVRILPPYGVERGTATGDSLRKVDDLLIALPAEGLTVAPGDPAPDGSDATYRMKIDGIVYVTVTLQKLYSGNQIAVYIFQCRK